MTPPVKDRRYTLRWRGRVWRHALYLGRQECVLRRGELIVMGPAFRVLDGAFDGVTLVLSSWIGVEIEPEPDPPIVIEGGWRCA